jgi:hypothetical protein
VCLGNSLDADGNRGPDAADALDAVDAVDAVDAANALPGCLTSNIMDRHWTTETFVVIVRGILIFIRVLPHRPSPSILFHVHQVIRINEQLLYFLRQLRQPLLVRGISAYQPSFPKHLSLTQEMNQNKIPSS